MTTELTVFGMETGAGDDIAEMLSKTRSGRLSRTHRSSRFYDNNDVVVEEDSRPISKADDWKLMPEVKMYHQQGKADKLKNRKLGVTWQDLTVRGTGSGNTHNKNVLLQFNVPKLVKEARHKQPLNTIFNNTHGCMKPGKILFVLGYPVSRCTIFLECWRTTETGIQILQGT